MRPNAISIWGVMLALAVFAGMAATLGVLGNVFAIIAGAIALVIAVWWGVNQIRLRRVVTVRYLIPQAHYAERQFQEAPDQERHVETPTVAVGEYPIMFRIHSSMNIAILSIATQFVGSESGKPKIVGGFDNPLWVRSIASVSGPQYQNWHGVVYPVEDTKPRHLLKGPSVRGVRVRTSGSWEGKARLVFNVDGGPTIVRSLR